MKHLESLGLDTSDASLLYLGHNQFAMNEREDDLVSAGVASYAYTLNDILEKLSNEIVFYTCTFNLGLNTKNCPVYIMNDSNGEFLKYAVNTDSRWTPLDAAYKMLCWCIENNYINN